MRPSTIDDALDLERILRLLQRHMSRRTYIALLLTLAFRLSRRDACSMVGITHSALTQSLDRVRGLVERRSCPDAF